MSIPVPAKIVASLYSPIFYLKKIETTDLDFLFTPLLPQLLRSYKLMPYNGGSFYETRIWTRTQLEGSPDFDKQSTRVRAWKTETHSP